VKIVKWRVVTYNVSFFVFEVFRQKLLLILPFSGCFNSPLSLCKNHSNRNICTCCQRHMRGFVAFGFGIKEKGTKIYLSKNTIYRHSQFSATCRTHCFFFFLYSSFITMLLTFTAEKFVLA